MVFITTHTMTSTRAIDPVTMCKSAHQACALVKALANTDRLLLLSHLRAGELSVRQLESFTGIRQPSLSQQLAVLRRSDLVQRRRDLRNCVYYRITSAEALEILGTIFPGTQHVLHS